MGVLRYITHPEVRVDPANDVKRWCLSDLGKQRAQAMLQQPWIENLSRIISSAEIKAMETAEFLAAQLRIDIEIREDTGENDRSSTGFVPPEQFEKLADAFFEQADQSIQGWETAVQAQERIVGALEDLLQHRQDTDIAVIGHGAVGTLLYCHLAGYQIDRRYDQSGQGHYFTVDLELNQVMHPWRRIDTIESR